MITYIHIAIYGTAQPQGNRCSQFIHEQLSKTLKKLLSNIPVTHVLGLASKRQVAGKMLH